MLKICLSRRGKRKHATYRVVVLEKHKDPVGNFTEDLGFYDPHSKKADLKLERIEYWVKKGAKKSNRIENLLKRFDANKKLIKVSNKRKKIAKQKKAVKEEQKKEEKKVPEKISEKAPEKKK